VIERHGRPPYRTAFVACVKCRVMFCVPEPLEPEPAVTIVAWSQPKPPG
jgi:hypothetical protein